MLTEEKTLRCRQNWLTWHRAAGTAKTVVTVQAWGIYTSQILLRGNYGVLQVNILQTHRQVRWEGVS